MMKKGDKNMKILDKGIARDINGVLYAYENKDELAFGTSFEDSDEVIKPKKSNDVFRQREMTREEAFDMVMG